MGSYDTIQKTSRFLLLKPLQGDDKQTLPAGGLPSAPSSSFVRSRSEWVSLGQNYPHANHRTRTTWQNKCWIEYQKIRWIECQNLCQIESKILARWECRKECRIESKLLVSWRLSLDAFRRTGQTSLKQRCSVQQWCGPQPNDRI